MSEGLYALLGVIIGAIATMISSLLRDTLRTRRERRGVASAISASIHDQPPLSAPGWILVDNSLGDLRGPSRA